MIETINEAPVDATVEPAKAYTGKKVTCPHCHEEMLVNFSVDICEVKSPRGDTPAATPADKAARWKQSLDGSQIAMLDAAARSGILGSFDQAVKRSMADALPKNLEKFFLDWLKLARTKTISAWALNEFRDTYGDERIEFYVSQSIGAVVAGGRIRMFMPVELLFGSTVKIMASGMASKIPADVAGVRQWVRTKMGYVPADCPSALSEMRKRCFGDFASPSL